ncbi:MAG TPA: hypothetical protein VK338_04075 [Candidatus Nitrosocosmicus sp.]|nr:hypothetical protein [Candidatus Nitrosocosmicus sp.]
MSERFSENPFDLPQLETPLVSESQYDSPHEKASFPVAPKTNISDYHELAYFDLNNMQKHSNN